MDIKGLLEDEDFKEKLSALAGALTVLSDTPARNLSQSASVWTFHHLTAFNIP